MQGDGNFVVYNASNAPLWASDTGGSPGAYVALGDSGEFDVTSAGATTIWSPGRLVLGGAA